MRLPAKCVEEPRDIPTPGNALFRFNANQPPQSLVAPEFRERGLDAHVPQGNSQQNHSPGDMHRAIIASTAAMLSQPLQELGIGDGTEKLSDRAQARTVLQAIPGE